MPHHAAAPFLPPFFFLLRPPSPSCVAEEPAAAVAVDLAVDMSRAAETVAPCGPRICAAFFLSRLVLRYVERSLVGSHLSASGIRPGFAGSKSLGRRGLRFLRRLLGPMPGSGVATSSPTHRLPVALPEAATAEECLLETESCRFSSASTSTSSSSPAPTTSGSSSSCSAAKFGSKCEAATTMRARAEMSRGSATSSCCCA
mmetsp:Transcript_10399/g.26184  ORF Transcript_10399/g.26184 Transcript_10399/m.26184 type:complete len:201 (-) Transcript_10399:1556-2158(-)